MSEKPEVMILIKSWSPGSGSNTGASPALWSAEVDPGPLLSATVQGKTTLTANSLSALQTAITNLVGPWFA
jgi:hypothetical protein